MRLFELKSTIDWDWTHQDRNSATVDFQVGDSKVNVEFVGGSTGIFLIEFKRDGKMTMTGQGKEMQILATVLEIVEEFIHEYQPKAIAFSGMFQDKGRLKLYTRLIKTLERKGWQVKINDTDKARGFIVYSPKN